MGSSVVCVSHARYVGIYRPWSNSGVLSMGTNLHRGTRDLASSAFQCDAKAQGCPEQGIQQGFQLEIPVVYQQFSSYETYVVAVHVMHCQF